ncbi:hypothetical protein ACHAW5_011110 [Stephanodiscus triporus]|uniref:SD-repeat containing protein B domain-containing protein n=1 Tax=Stephanodiscus triporus TaxID=2934178 RepID=A0ABD3MEJ7_9STRA
MPGYYMVVVRPPGGYATSSFWSGGAPGGDVVVDANDDDDAAANNLDNDIDPETGSTACIMLTGEDAVIYRNIGMVPLADDGSDASDFIGGDEPPVTISGIVFRDVDDDGFFDAAAGNDEIGLSDVLVALFVCDDDDGGIELTSSRTAANGQYVFSDLDAGSYLVRFSPPGGYRISSVWSGTVNYADNHANPATSGTACQQYQAGEVANALDAGMSSISKTPTARPSSAPSTWSPSSAPVAAAAPGICNEDGSVGTTTNDAAGSNDKNVQGVNVAFEYAITSVNEAPIDSDQVAKFEDELNTRLACAYFYDDCLSCKVDKKDKAGRVRVRRTSSRARFMFNVNNSSLAGISAFPRDEPVCADDSQSDCSVMNGKFTAYFPDDMTPDAIGQESQQILVIVKNEMEKNDFDGMQVSYIAPLPTVSSAEKVSGSDVEGNGGISNGAMVGIVFALVIFPIALLAILVNLNKKKRNRESLNIRNAVPSGGGRLDSIQQLKQDYYESDSDSSGSSDDLSSVLSGETEEGDSATFSAPSGVSGDTFLSNVAQAPPRGTDEASTSSSSASSASTSSEDEDSTTEISYDDEYETSFDKLVPPRVDDHRDNLQTDDENSAIYKDRSVADEYDGREYSAGRIDEGGGDSMTNRGTRGRGRTRQEDNYTQGQDIEYIPQNYDSKHQSHNNDDYDDEVRSITSADPPGTSYRDLPQENSFDNSQGHFQAYESESNGRGDVNDPFDSVFNHRIQVLPHQSSVDGHHSFQSGNSDGYDGIDSFPQESWESRQSVRSSRSPRLQGQNTRGDPRYVDGGENVNNHDYIQDYIEDNYVDRDGHNYKQDNVSKPPFNDNYHQDSDGYNNGRNTSLQESKGSRRSVHSHRSSQSHGRNKLGDLRYVNDGESLNSQDIARNQDYIDDNYVDREGHNYKQNRPPTPPIDDNYQKDIEYYPQDDENYGDESNDISHDHDYIGDISTEENDSNAGSAATNPRSNKSPGASVGRRGSPNNERYGEDEGGITNLVKSLSDIQTRLASKGKPALPEAVLTQQELAVRTKPTKNPFDMYAHLAPK